MEILQYAVWRMNKKITKKENISKFSALNWFCIPLILYTWILVGLFGSLFLEYYWIVKLFRENSSCVAVIYFGYVIGLYSLVYLLKTKRKIYLEFELNKGKFTQLSKSKRIIYEAYFFISFLLFFIYNVSAGWAYKEVYM